MLCGKRFSSRKDADAFCVRLKNCQRLSCRPLSRQTRKTPQPIAVICGSARLFSFTGKPTRPGKSDRPSFHVKRRAEKSVHLPATFPPLATFIGTSTPKQNPSVKDLRVEKFVKRIYLSCMLCWCVCVPCCFLCIDLGTGPAHKNLALACAWVQPIRYEK